MHQKLWEIENFIKKFTMYKTVDLRKMKKIKKNIYNVVNEVFYIWIFLIVLIQCLLQKMKKWLFLKKLKEKFDGNVIKNCKIWYKKFNLFSKFRMSYIKFFMKKIKKIIKNKRIEV